MTTRREFIQMSVAASALPFTGVTSAGASATERETSGASPAAWPVYRFVVDDRFPESVAAGRAAAERGTAVQVMDGGDITPFWFDELSLRWKQERVAIAGMTGHGPLFVLERFAWDHRMRVVVRATEKSDEPEPLFSWLIAPATDAV